MPVGAPVQLELEVGRRHPQLLGAAVRLEAGRRARARPTRCRCRSTRPASSTAPAPSICGTAARLDADSGRGRSRRSSSTPGSAQQQPAGHAAADCARGEQVSCRTPASAATPFAALAATAHGRPGPDPRRQPRDASGAGVRRQHPGHLRALDPRSAGGQARRADAGVPATCQRRRPERAGRLPGEPEVADVATVAPPYPVAAGASRGRAGLLRWVTTVDHKASASSTC